MGCMQKTQDTKKEPTVAELQQQLAEKDKVIEDYTNHLKRLQADFENYVKRSDKERIEVIKFANEKLVMKLLIILDDFERSLEQMKKTQTQQEVIHGVDIVFKEFHKILEAEGLKPIIAKGKPFDPYQHEVVTCVSKDDCPENTVIDEVQKGYLFGDHPLRYAKVIVTKPTKKKQTTETKGGV